MCPPPVVIDSVTATPNPDDPASLEFQVSLVNPTLDCGGLDADDGLRYSWVVDDSVDGLQADTATATLSFARTNVLGQFFRGHVEAICTKTYDNDGTPTTLDLRASIEFYVDCH